tara:strand:+ start:16685 stop:17326 length:642 start_codon:yes stop_codon:yes gene_type:complete
MLIKKLFILIIQIIGRTWSYLYPYKLNAFLTIITAHLYSSWVSKGFKLFGKESLIFPYCDLFGKNYISLGDNCIISSGTSLTAWDKHQSNFYSPKIIIGNNVSIGAHSHITAINRIEIGNNVLTGKRITISDNSHGNSQLDSLMTPPAYRALVSKGPVIIEDGVWIGEKVTILDNVKIGKNAIIGANAVVTTDLPANCIAVGVPAKVIKIIRD